MDVYILAHVMHAGMSMFSTRNGLYEKARKQFKITDGIKLFTYSFYKQNRESVQAFFAQIYSEAEASKVRSGLGTGFGVCFYLAQGLGFAPI